MNAHARLFLCPNCGGDMLTDNVNHATHVALGRAVCSYICHTEFYALKGGEDDDRHQLPLRLNPG